MKNRISQDSFFKFFLLSLLVHLFFLLLIYIGFSGYKANKEEEKVITFEMLPVGEVNKVKNKKKQTKKTVNTKKEEAKSTKKSAKSHKKTSTSQKPTQQAREQNNKKHTEDQKIEKELPKTDKLKSEAPPEPAKKSKDIFNSEIVKNLDKEKRVSDNKKTSTKKSDTSDKNSSKSKQAKGLNNEKTNQDEIDSLLKNLEEESEGNLKNSSKISRANSKDNNDAFSSLEDVDEEFITNDEIIRQQIKKHWSQPVASATENISVSVNLFLEEDGTIQKYKIKSIHCPARKQILCSAVSDSIIRAITNASPLVNLNIKDYSSWKQINIVFNTKN